MISTVNNRIFTQSISSKHQNTPVKNKVNEEANESTSEKIAEAGKQSKNDIHLQTKNSNVAATQSSKTGTGNIVDLHA
jgi:hypothetical protein